jgi:hypothetical protein
MPTIKIADIPRPCTSSDHNPPSHMVFSPGIYEHTCSACGHKTRFTVHGASYCNGYGPGLNITWSGGMTNGQATGIRPESWN